MKSSEKTESLVTSLFLGLFLQLVKPWIVISAYKELTDFHPTVVNNYELYLTVMQGIIQGAMKISFTVAFLLAEAAFLLVPVLFYRWLVSEDQSEAGADQR